MAIAKKALLLLMLSLMLAALVTTMPVANVAVVNHADNGAALSKLDSRHLIITSCGILGNSCAFATASDVALATDNIKAENKATSDDAISNMNPDLPNASIDGLAATVPTETDNGLDVRAPKLIITSCGILGSSCAFTESENNSTSSNAAPVDTDAHGDSVDFKDEGEEGGSDKAKNAATNLDINTSDGGGDDTTKDLSVDAGDGHDNGTSSNPSSTALTCSGTIAIAAIAEFDTVGPE